MKNLKLIGQKIASIVTDVAFIPTTEVLTFFILFVFLFARARACVFRCCRSHDLCPVKVRAQQTRYNLTNYSIYTKYANTVLYNLSTSFLVQRIVVKIILFCSYLYRSHCVCDEALYYCLKAATHPAAHIMGHLYFNVMKIPCVEDDPQAERTSVELGRRFVPVKMNY